MRIPGPGGFFKLYLILVHMKANIIKSTFFFGILWIYIALVNKLQHRVILERTLDSTRDFVWDLPILKLIFYYWNNVLTTTPNQITYIKFPRPFQKIYMYILFPEHYQAWKYVRSISVTFPGFSWPYEPCRWPPTLSLFLLKISSVKGSFFFNKGLFKEDLLFFLPFYVTCLEVTSDWFGATYGNWS